jgi:LacI family transcriptional regulator
MISVEKMFSLVLISTIVMGTPATLKKISTQLNLSISTVSRALKNHPDISENTKRKVKELAALMDYEPNAYAVNLRTNKSKVLGLIVPTISNMFNDSFIAAAEKDARENGYSLMILQSGDDPVQEVENLKLCKHYRVDGIMISVVADSYSSTAFEKYGESGIPVLFFDRVPDTDRFDTVCMADEEAATIAANTIVKYKKKNVLALFGNEELSITKKRKEAFISVLAKEGPEISYKVLCCRTSDEARAAVAEALSKNPKPDHIFCMSDELLIGAMKSINRAGLKVPQEVSVLAISNGFIPPLFSPEITYIETSGYELGKLSIKRMLENLNEKSEPKAIILPSRFVEGGSL